MDKPFQFSMQRLFAAVTLFSISAWLARLCAAVDQPSVTDSAIIAFFLSLFGCAAAFIGGCGVITESGARKIIIPISALLAIGSLLLLLVLVGRLLQGN
jgi:hypothetical protein